jgi:valyl-tRNA synthetase
VLVTGFDIIFFWVARMIMMGLKFMGDVPFRDVYIHGLIRDHDGQKMSKSKGNVLDPLDIIDGVDLETLVTKRTTGMMQDHLRAKIEKATRKEFPEGIGRFGADALRFTYAALATTGRDIRFDMGRVEGYKNFCNKLWNAARYVLMNTEALDDGDMQFSAADRWIRARLDATTRDIQRHFATYRLDLAVQAVYEFTWHEFCDWYLELSKPVLQSDSASPELQRGTRRTLIDTLEAILRLLHPLMPFITEELWEPVAERAGIEGETIMLRPFPEPDDAAMDEAAIADIDWVRQFILGIRQIRGEMDISPGKALPVLLHHASESDRRLAREHAHLLERVGRVESVAVLDEGEQPPASATALLGDMRLLVPMKGLIDVDAERSRLDKQLEKTRTELAKANGKLANEKFVNNAPPAVVTQERERVAEFEKTITQLTEQLAKLEAIS